MARPVVTPVPERTDELPPFELPVAHTSLQAPPDAWPIYISTATLFSGSLQNRVADLPSRELQSASGFGAEHKRSTPYDLFLMPLTKALAMRQCDANGQVAPRAIVHAHPTTPYRILLEVLFTLAQSDYTEIYLAVKPADANVAPQGNALRVLTKESSRLTIFIVDAGFSVFGPDRKRVGTGCTGIGFPTVPRAHGSLDYAGLSGCLQQLVVGDSPVNLALVANAGTDLQTLVSTVDAANAANPLAFGSSFSAKVPVAAGATSANDVEPPASGSLPSAAGTVHGLRDSFRACYDAMLARKPDGVGKVQLSMKVGEDGSVQSVSVIPTGTLDAELATCVRQIAMNARFEQPVGGPVMIAVPITFQPKGAQLSSPACQNANSRSGS